jgi:hypothetical protein
MTLSSSQLRIVGAWHDQLFWVVNTSNGWREPGQLDGCGIRRRVAKMAGSIEGSVSECRRLTAVGYLDGTLNQVSWFDLLEMRQCRTVFRGRHPAY